MASVVVELSPQDNIRLQSLCGPFDEHLSFIEDKFHVIIKRNGFEFTIEKDDAYQTPDFVLTNIGKLLKKLYNETAPVKGRVKFLDLHTVHLIISESRILAQHDGNDKQSSIGNVSVKTKRGVIRARGERQQNYLNNIVTHDITFGIGPAGTGKTYLAVAAAVEALERQEVRRILLTRPAVEAGEKLGFLPGDLAQKIDPYLRPLYDALFEMLGFETVNKFMERNIIEIAPLAYMRGRTLNDSFIILDESQNTTVEQMKMFLTRIGFNSKAVITGDITQIDLPRSQKSGLKHAKEVLHEVEGLSFNYFYAHDVVRHPLVAKVVQAYEKFELLEEHKGAERKAEQLRTTKERLETKESE